MLEKEKEKQAFSEYPYGGCISILFLPLVLSFANLSREYRQISTYLETHTQRRPMMPAAAAGAIAAIPHQDRDQEEVGG